MKPIVLTSKLADKHLNMILGEHASIIDGINNQSLKVQQYKEQEDLKSKENAEKKAISDKEQMEMQNKQRELDIKAQALNI